MLNWCHKIVCCSCNELEHKISLILKHNINCVAIVQLHSVAKSCVYIRADYVYNSDIFQSSMVLTYTQPQTSVQATTVLIYLILRAIAIYSYS